MPRHRLQRQGSANWGHSSLRKGTHSVMCSQCGSSDHIASHSEFMNSGSRADGKGKSSDSRYSSSKADLESGVETGVEHWLLALISIVAASDSSVIVDLAGQAGAESSWQPESLSSSVEEAGEGAEVVAGAAAAAAAAASSWICCWGRPGGAYAGGESGKLRGAERPRRQTTATSKARAASSAVA